MVTTFENIALPKIIYKYRDWNNDKHKRILNNCEIYFAAPFDCDEQHECNLPRDYDSVNEEMLYKYFYETSLSQGYKTEEERKEIAKYMVTNSPFNTKDHRQRAECLLRNELNKRLSVFCVSEHKDNFHLWNTFGAYQTGFCVGINTIQMFKSTETFGSGDKIKYYPIDSPPKIRPFCFSDNERVEDMLKVIYSLPDIYINEDEYRLSKIDIVKKEVIIPTKCFEEVILGSKISSSNKIEIINQVKNNLPNCKIYQAHYDKDKKIYSYEETN